MPRPQRGEYKPKRNVESYAHRYKESLGVPVLKRSIEEILEDYGQQVPPEEWLKLPDDLIDRLDHHTSGADE